MPPPAHLAKSSTPLHDRRERTPRGLPPTVQAKATPPEARTRKASQDGSSRQSSKERGRTPRSGAAEGGAGEATSLEGLVTRIATTMAEAVGPPTDDDLARTMIDAFAPNPYGEQAGLGDEVLFAIKSKAKRC